MTLICKRFEGNGKHFHAKAQIQRGSYLVNLHAQNNTVIKKTHTYLRRSSVLVKLQAQNNTVIKKNTHSNEFSFSKVEGSRRFDDPILAAGLRK